MSDNRSREEKLASIKLARARAKEAREGRNTVKAKSNLSEIKKQEIQLNPVNSVSSGVYSPGSSIPLIKFDIASSPNPIYLDGDSLRINGKITVTGATNTGRNFVDNFGGRFGSCIDTITISSKRLNQVIERVNNAWRVAPTVISALHGNEDINTVLCHEGGHYETTILGRHAVVANDGTKGQAFSSRLFAGVLASGQALDISDAGFGGLVIEILLKPNVSYCFGADAATAQASYEVSDLQLTACLYEKPTAPPKAQSFAFNSLSTIFQTVNSSVSVVALTPGLKQVSSIITNFMNANEIGNQNFNSGRLGNIGQLRALRYSINGQLDPLQYRLLTDEEANDDLAPAGQLHRARCMVDRNYLESVNIRRYSEVGRCVNAWNNWNSGVVDRSQTANNNGCEQGTTAGFGILYDSYGTGKDLSQTVFSFELEASGTDLDGTAATAQGAYMIFLNKNEVLMSPGGIQIAR